MAEDLISNEFTLDPEDFLVYFCNPARDSLRKIVFNGPLSHLRNRFICWRVFLGIFSESSPISSWVETSRSLRDKYYSIQDSYKVKPT